MPSAPIHPMAQEGRRITFASHKEPKTVYPGVITRVDGSTLDVRLDGQRSNLRVHADYAGIQYLNEIGPVPELPMGPFHPTAADFANVQYDGVLLAECADGDLIALTPDPVQAVAAMNAHLRQKGLDAELATDDVQRRWAVFKWQPPESECPWTVDWADADAAMAVPLHYLPAYADKDSSR
ncbi:hypothetical protein ABZ468_43950 [Streptomyces sp. NPDC005708]|uniref:hypothetical protein n=1 Tax=unclassified Streptomyces TaxID=2593676 RepID=UPI0033F5EE36